VHDRTLAAPEASLLHDVDHLGIVAPDLAAAARFYRETLRCDVSQPIEPPGQGIALVFVSFGNLRVELLSPTMARSPLGSVLEDYTVNDFLDRQPEGGLHHVCYVVEDIAAVVARLAESGARVLGSGRPIIGASGQPIVFLDPRSGAGSLIELKQRAQR
jgi:methylmalonyl-CoA/ethylmalonyl-CoA epimerase